MTDKVRRKIRELLKDRQFSMRQASLAMDRNEAYLQQFLNTGSPIALKEQERAKLAAYFGIPLEELGLNIEIFDLKPQKTMLEVIGVTQAGVWKEVEVEAETMHKHIPIGPDEKYADIKQFALLVAGNSMNKCFQDGDYAICIDFASSGRNIHDGDLVVATRTDHGKVETTLKRVRALNGKLELWPESTDSRYQKPIELSNGNPEIDVSITGLVIGRYQRF